MEVSNIMELFITPSIGISQNVKLFQDNFVDLSKRVVKLDGVASNIPMVPAS